MIRPWSLTDEVTVYPMVEDATDRYGNEVTKRGDGVTVAARVEPLRSPRGDVELLQGRDTTITEYTVYTAPCEALTATAVVEWNGEQWDVQGEPKAFTHLLGGASHLETYIKRIEG